MNSSTTSPVLAVIEESISIPLALLPTESCSLVATKLSDSSIESGDPQLRIDDTSLDHKERLAQFYKSLPLPQGTKSIRLLDIEAASASDDSSPIVGTLRVVDLETQPTFSALSYVWGQDQNPQKVFCGDLALGLTENGHDALQHLRAKLGKFTIWIDAICINQQDNTEKGHQISFMGDIYSKAESAYMWLGKGNEKSDNAMAFLAEGGLLDYFTPNSSAKGWAFIPRSWAALWSLYTFSEDRSINPTSEHSWPFRVPRQYPDLYINLDHIVELLNRDWIRRIWTYQEIIMSSHPIVVCGHRHLQWSRLVHSLVFLEDIATTNRNHLYKDILYTWAKLVYSKVHFDTPDANLDVSSPEPTGITQLEHYKSFTRSILRRGRYISLGLCILGGVSVYLMMMAVITAIIFWSTKLFFLLLWGVLVIIVFIAGINIPVYWLSDKNAGSNTQGALVDIIIGRHATNLKDKAFGILPVLQRLLGMPLPDPDYSLPTGQVYKELCTHILASTKSLDFLLPAAIHGLPDQPSWVPDWSKDYSKGWIQPEIQKLFKNSELLSRENDNSLIVSIRHVGIVSSCYTFRKTEDSYDETEKSIHLENLETMMNFIATLKFLRSLRFFVDIIATNFSDGNVFDPQSLSKKWFFMRFYWKQGTYPPSDGTRGVLRKLIIMEKQKKFRRHYFLHNHIDLCNILAKNKLMLFRAEGISSRSSIGICTDNVQPGDKAVFVHGGNSLFIIRGASHSAKLISPAIMALDIDPRLRPPSKIQTVSQLIESEKLNTEEYALT